MVKDRCNVHNVDKNDQKVASSIAATGFGLTALCIGQQRGFISNDDALERVFATLRFLWRKLPNHRGFFYHFANPETGERMFDSEVSSVDTAILLCGVLTCREHFRHPGVAELANLIFNRVDWTWLSEDTSLLTHGWTPEVGFLSSRWDYYSELMMMYLLGMGSSAYPLKAETWNAWKRLTFEYIATLATCRPTCPPPRMNAVGVARMGSTKCRASRRRSVRCRTRGWRSD